MNALNTKLRHLFKGPYINPGWKNLYPYIFILIVTLIFFYPVLTGKVPLPADALVGAHTPWTELKWEKYPAGIPIRNQEITDSISQFYPWRSYVGRSWREGEIALWNPYMFSGAPFLASLHSAVLYPLNAVYLFFNDITSWSLLIYFQIILAAIFTYLLLRYLGLTRAASVFGGITFAFSGYMIAWLEFATGGHAGLWLPLLLFFEFKLLRSGNIKYIPGIALTFFLIFTAGDFQVPFYIVLTYIMIGFYHIIFDGKLLKKVKLSLKLLSAFLAGLGVSAIQLIPTIELYVNSIRQKDPYIAEYNFGLMDYSKALNFIWPDFFGNVVTRNYWGRFGFHEYLAFTGIISLIFVIYTLFKKKDLTERSFFLLLAVSLIFLFPNPISYLPYRFNFPGLGTSSASRIIFLADFCIAVLSSYGFYKYRNLKDHSGVKRVTLWFFIITVGTAAGLLITLIVLNKYPHMSFEPQMISNIKVALKNMVPGTFIVLALILLMTAGNKKLPLINKKIKIKFISLLILIFASAEMLYFANKNTPFSPREFVFPTTKTIDFLKNQEIPYRIAGPGIPLNYFMYYGIASVEGYDSLYPLSNAEWFSLNNFEDLKHLPRRYGEIADYSSPLLNLANVKYVIDYRKNISNRMADKDGSFQKGIGEPQFIKVFSEGKVDVFENIKVLPKIWAAHEVSYVKNKDDAIRELLNLSGRKLIIDEPLDRLSIRNNPELTFTDYKEGFNKISFDLNLSSATLVFISESYSKDWKALVDKVEVPVYRANLYFMAIPMDAGVHKVELVYLPESYRLGLYFTSGSILILILIWLISFNAQKLKKVEKY